MRHKIVDLIPMMKKLLYLFLIFLLLAPTCVFAQQDQSELSIRLRRDFGYGGFGNDIEGLFTIIPSGPGDLAQVRFYIDGQLMAEVREAPFNHQFRTGEYELGLHTIHAIGITAEGEELRSNEISAQFVAPEVGRNAAVTIVLVVLGLILGVMIISGLVTMLTRRGSKTAGAVPTSYGLLGGTVCPNCSKPFARHWWGLNLVTGKLDRCPHCGKWSMTRRAYPEQLRLAEEIMRQEQGPRVEKPSVEKSQDYQRELDESKYLD